MKQVVREDDKITIKKIREKTGKNKRMDWYQKKLRNISPYFTWFFLHAGISADQVTLLSILPVIFGSFLLLFKNPLYWILGWVIMQLYCIIDCADGEVARYKNNSTKFGLVVDEFLHPVVNVIVLIFVMFGLFFMYKSFYVFIFGVSAIVFILLNRLLKLSFSFEKNSILSKHIGGGKIPLGGLIHVFLIASILDTFSYNFRLLFLILIGIISPLVFVQNMINEYKSSLGRK